MPNRSKWEAFFSEFSDDQKKQFMRNLNMHFGRMIRCHLRKMQEAMRKLRESHR